MVYVYAVAGLFPLIPAWMAFGVAFHHVQTREWSHALGMTIAGLALVAGSLALIAPAFQTGR